MRENHQDILNELGYRNNEHALKFGFVRIGLFSLSIGYVEFKTKLTQKRFETIWLYMITNRPKTIAFTFDKINATIKLNDFLECNKVSDFMRLLEVNSK